jgi:hypothetical protein
MKALENAGRGVEAAARLHIHTTEARSSEATTLKLEAFILAFEVRGV